MDELAMVREGNRLAPVDEMSAEELGRVPQGQQVLVTVRVPRNLRQHRLAWALATKVAESCDWLNDREDAMTWLKIKARHVRYVHDHSSNETHIIPKSIRFAALTQQGFDRVLNRMVWVVITEILPGVDYNGLRAEIEKMVGIDPGPEPTEKPTARKRRKPTDESKQAAASTGTTTKGGNRKGGDGGGVKPPPPSSDTAQPVQDESSVPAVVADPELPKTPGQWVVYAKRWLEDARTNRMPSALVMTRWSREMALRNAVGVTQEMRDPVFEVYSDALDELRKLEATP